MADFWAGYISGAASIIIGNPLDLIKVRVQATSNPPRGSASHGPLSTSQPNPASSIASRAPGTVKPAALKGVRDLLAGLPAPIITYGALNALLFWSYNRSIAFFPANATDEGTKSVYPLYAHFTAGCIAGMASFIVSAPTEVVKCRAQVAAGTRGQTALEVPHTSWAITKSIIRNKGIPGLYHGGVITSLRDSLGYGFYFLTYEGCTRYLHEHPLWGKSAEGDVGSGAGMSEASIILLAGGLAGVATWLSVFPLDVVKTRVQTQPLAVIDERRIQAPSTTMTASQTLTDRTSLLSTQGSAHSESANPKNTTVKPLGAWRIAVEAYRNEGVGVFFRGLGVCSLRAFIVNAAQFWVYEWCMKAFTKSTN